MKKILSIILACAMIMSLFCVVPASAAHVSAGDAYWTEDFETGASGSLFLNAGTITAGGHNGSAYSALKTATVAADAVACKAGDLTLQDLALKSFTPGDNVKLTFKYKLTHALAANGKFTLHAGYCVDQGDNSYGGTSYVVTTHNIPNLTDTANWQTATFEFKVPEDAWLRTEYDDAGNLNVSGTAQKPIGYYDYYLSMLILRWGPASMAGNNLASAPAESGKAGYYIDDMVLERTVDQKDPEIQMFDGSNDLAFVAGMYSGKEKVQDPLSSVDNTVYKVKPGANATSPGLLVFHADYTNVELSVGDVVKFSYRALVDENSHGGVIKGNDVRFTTGTISASSHTATAFGPEDNKANFDNVPFDMTKHTEWQEFTHEYTVTEAGTLSGVRFWWTDDLYTNNNKEDDTEGVVHDNEVFHYFDDLKLEVIYADCKTPTATLTKAEVGEDGVVTPAYNFAAATADANGTDASVYKLLNANGGVIASGLVSAGITVPEGKTAATLEIVPVSSNGYIGDVVTCAITEAAPELPVIEKTEFANGLTGLELKVKDAITGAKLIFVVYDDNNKMIDFEIVDNFAKEAGSHTISVPSLDDGAKTVVMLWQNTTACTPLADALEVE